MFTVGSDLIEAQRERLTSSLSLQEMNVTAYTLEAVKTVFVEVFCSPQSSMENPSLRVSGHGSSTSRTFIVENFTEDEYGLWAIDEATGKQGFIYDDVFGHGTTTSVFGNPESFRIVKIKEEKEKVKEKEKAKVDPEELVEHTLVKNKHRTLNGGQKKIVFGGPLVKEARKVLRQPTATSLKMISVPIIQRKVQVMNTTRTKEEARIRQEKRQGKCLSSIRTFSLRNTS